MRKMTVREGTWFAVPLRSGGFAAGVVARVARGGRIVLGYFFRPVWERPPALDEVKGFRPDVAVKVLRFGDLGFIEGSWPVVGRDPGWVRDDWPVPPFIRRDETSRTAWLVRYSDDDPGMVESESRTPYDTDLTTGGLFGAGAVEIVLTTLLSKAGSEPELDESKGTTRQG